MSKKDTCFLSKNNNIQDINPFLLKKHSNIQEGYHHLFEKL